MERYSRHAEKYRLFVAVAVPDDVKAKMEAAQADLRRVLPDRNVRWARREQFHLTLRFLGDVEAARVEALAEAIRAACAGFGALHLRAERIGCFPDRGYPRVVWVGVRDQAEQLPRLQQVVQAATEGFTSRTERGAIHRPPDAGAHQGHQASGGGSPRRSGGGHGGPGLRPMDGLPDRADAQRAVAPGRAAQQPGLHRAGRRCLR